MITVPMLYLFEFFKLLYKVTGQNLIFGENKIVNTSSEVSV